MRIARIAHLQRLRLGHEHVEELLVHRLFDDHARSGHADLALMNEHAEAGGIDRVLEMRVLHHQQRALAAHFQIELLAAPGALDADLASDGGRAGKQNRLHARVAVQTLRRAWDHRRSPH